VQCPALVDLDFRGGRCAEDHPVTFVFTALPHAVAGVELRVSLPYHSRPASDIRLAAQDPSNGPGPSSSSFGSAILFRHSFRYLFRCLFDYLFD